MSAPRFFVEQAASAGALIDLAAADVRHAALVLRLQPADEVVVVSGGSAWRAQVASIDSRRATVKVLAEISAPSELPQPVTILQALPKANKMDFVIEKVVELGATRIVPVQTGRSYGGASDSKLERWRKIARAAAAQSRRLIVPEVTAAMPWDAAVQHFATVSQLLVAHESAAAGSLAHALTRDTKALSLAAGPEGSFTPTEVEIAQRHGAALVSLGPTILRTETAALAMLAAAAALRHWW